MIYFKYSKKDLVARIMLCRRDFCGLERSCAFGEKDKRLSGKADNRANGNSPLKKGVRGLYLKVTEHKVTKRQSS
jgi:hypothetical protein